MKPGDGPPIPPLAMADRLSRELGPGWVVTYETDEERFQKDSDQGERG